MLDYSRVRVDYRDSPSFSHTDLPFDYQPWIKPFILLGFGFLLGLGLHTKSVHASHQKKEMPAKVTCVDHSRR